MKKYRTRGFTLVELIVVLVILALLAAFVVPALTGYIDKAKDSAVISRAQQAYTASQTIASEYYAHPVNSDKETQANKNNTTSTHGYWISITNQKQYAGKTYKYPYMQDCYDLMDAATLPEFRMVAIINEHALGKIMYLSYYDIESHRVAYYDANTQQWTVQKRPSNEKVEPSTGWVYDGAVYTKGDWINDGKFTN